MKKNSLKNFRRFTLLAAFVFFQYSDGVAQKKMTQERLDSINACIVQFFKDKGYFEENRPLEKCLKSIHCNDLISSKWLGDNEVGIYSIGALVSHTKRFLLIVETGGWTIEDNGPISELNQMLHFFQQHDITNDDVDAYLAALLRLHDYNNK